MCNPGFYFNCGVCCMLLSIWGVIQLCLMGVFYYIESTPLIEDVVPKKYSNYEEFIILTKLNFYATAVNCWVAAVIYLITGVISILCIVLSRQSKDDLLKKSEDEELFGEPEKSKGPTQKDKKHSRINREEIKHSDKKKSGVGLKHLDKKKSGENIKHPDKKKSGQDITHSDKKKSGQDITHSDKKKSGQDITHFDKKKSGQNIKHSDKKKSGEDIRHSEKKSEKKDIDEDPYFK